MTDDLV